LCRTLRLCMSRPLQAQSVSLSSHKLTEKHEQHFQRMPRNDTFEFSNKDLQKSDSFLSAAEQEGVFKCCQSDKSTEEEEEEEEEEEAG
ncbi:hypothetical protein GBF38_009268, partial [Nibea albiflora]